MDETSGGCPHGDASGTTVGQAGELLGDVRDDKRIGRRFDPGAAAVLIGQVAQGRRIDPWPCRHRAASSPATLQSAGVRLQI